MELKTRSGIRGEVEIKVWDRFGKLKIHRDFAPNQIQDLGLEEAATLLLTDTTAGGVAFDYIATGTGTGQAVTDSALAAEIADSGLERTAGTGTLTTTTTTNDTAQLVVTFTVTGTKAVTEAGMFNASSAGIIMAYQNFSALNLVNGDSLQITWKIVFDQA